ncbi:MAG: sigma-70 family RNA polymerase sigma factor [Anaerolineae bacterium]|nr:sigma-70 family RNA polymerase sigma factor [Anaerolineae bacterium]
MSEQTPVSEANLIERAREGQETAWSVVTGQHQEAVFHLAYLLLGDADDAQDVAQETFIRAFYALNRFDASRPLRPWLLRIAANVARNKYRSVSRYLAALGRWWQADSNSTRPTPQDEHFQQWEAQTMRRAIRRLRMSDQEIIYLRYFLELSVTETAEAVGIAPGTVKSRLHRALARLHQVVTQEFPELQEERGHQYEDVVK